MSSKKEKLTLKKKKKTSCFGDVNRLGDLQGDCLDAEGQ